MDKKEYILRQLSRADHKSYENYCITRIFHLVNNLDVQFVTQQMFKRNDGKIALADLYLPQIHMIVEIDEKHHLDQEDEDRKGTEEIIANKRKVFEEVVTYDLKPHRIDAWDSIEIVNNQIDEIVAEINRRIFDPEKPLPKWDCKYPETGEYIKAGKLDARDVPSFKTIQDIANLFNLYPDKKDVYKDGRYIGTQSAYFSDKAGSNIRVWCPKLTIDVDDYKNNPYLNEINADGSRIKESPKDPSKATEFLYSIIDGSERHLTKRYVFAKYKDSIGEDRYKFRGVFEIDKDESQKAGHRIWIKTDDQVSLSEYHNGID